MKQLFYHPSHMMTLNKSKFGDAVDDSVLLQNRNIAQIRSA